MSLLLLMLALASVSAEFGETVYVTPQRPAASRCAHHHSYSDCLVFQRRLTLVPCRKLGRLHGTAVGELVHVGLLHGTSFGLPGFASCRLVLRGEEVEELGCADGSTPIFDCSARTWLCCLGTVYEYAAADGLDMNNYDQGAVCSMCCAGVLLHTFALLLSWCSPAWCEGWQHILKCLTLEAFARADKQTRCADNQCHATCEVCLWQATMPSTYRHPLHLGAVPQGD